MKRILILSILSLTLLSTAAVAIAATTPSYTGTASVYGNDPVTGFRDPGDNNHPALAGASNKNPGIAICTRKPTCSTDRTTLGGWWKVRAPHGATAILQQTDIGPSYPGTVLGVNAVASRVIFKTNASKFPTGKGAWTVTYLGKTKPAGANQVATGGTL